MRSLPLLALLVGCVPHAPVQHPRGLEPARSTSDALNAALNPRRVALLVGVDAYDDATFPALAHAGHDADLLAGVLQDPAAGGFDEVTLLAAGPTRAAVLDALRALRRDLRREDVLLVYFSGHGTQVPDGDQAKRFLLQRDSRASDLETSALELEALQSWFSALAPARKVLIVDACFSGDGKSVVRPSTRQISDPETLTPSAASLGPGEAHLFATSPGRPALEDDGLGHGVYSYYLIEALSWAFQDADRDHDGVVTAWEAHDHARVHTLDRTGGVQVPEAAFRVVGTADLVLVGRPRERKRRDQSLVYLYPPPSHPLSGATLTVDGRPRGQLPGTVAIPPGRHHLSLSDASGELVAQGHLTLASGRPYRAEELQRLLRGPSLGLGIRPALGLAPAFTEALPTGAGGLELHGYLRDDTDPGRGLYVGGHLGMLGGARPVGSRSDGRALASAAVEIGAQQDWRMLRGRAGWTLGGVWMPPDHAGLDHEAQLDPYDIPDRAGWIFATTGPTAALGVVANETWSLVLQGRAGATLLDLDGDGASAPIFWGTVGLGPEVVLR